MIPVLLCFLRRTCSTSSRLPAPGAERLQLVTGGIPGECSCRSPVYKNHSINHNGWALCSVVLSCTDSSSFFSQLDLGIPAMTTCCNQHDMCYDTCGTNKYDCDSEFRLCLHGICADLKKSLGFVSKVQCE